MSTSPSFHSEPTRSFPAKEGDQSITSFAFLELWSQVWAKNVSPWYYYRLVG